MYIVLLFKLNMKFRRKQLYTQNLQVSQKNWLSTKKVSKNFQSNHKILNSFVRLLAVNIFDRSVENWPSTLFNICADKTTWHIEISIDNCRKFVYWTFLLYIYILFYREIEWFYIYTFYVEFRHKWKRKIKVWNITDLWKLRNFLHKGYTFLKL